jgi:hypothetical protein
MDYIPDSEAIRAMTRTIESDVIPRTEQGYPRGQLWAIVGLLRNLAIDIDNAAADESVESIRPTALTFDAPRIADDELLAAAQRHHEELLRLTARQAPLNSGRAVLGR